MMSQEPSVNPRVAEGLRVLARMIAADYKRRQRAARARNSQPTDTTETSQKLTAEGERRP